MAGRAGGAAGRRCAVVEGARAMVRGERTRKEPSMPQVDPYLVFNGTCAEAMRFYEKTLGGKLEMMTHAQSPMADQAPAGSANRIMHARLDLPGRVLMASDSMVGHPYEGMHGFSLSLHYP